MSTPNVNFFINFVPSKNKIGNNSTLKTRFEDKRKFFGCEKVENYLRYIDKGSKEKIDFVDYSGNEEKSKGVFNENGLMSKKTKAKYKTLFAETNSPIWHGLVSFEELFGLTHCNDHEEAYRIIKNQLPRFFKQAGFKPSNVLWFAGLHTNTDNRHIHFSFIEKEPLIVTRSNSKIKRFHNGKIGMFAINKAKIDIERTLVNNTLYRERDGLINYSKDVINNYELDKSLIKKLGQLKEYLPKEGRFSYDSKSLNHLRSTIDSAVLNIIKTNEGINGLYQKFLNSLAVKEYQLKEVCKRNSINFEYFSLEQKYMADINKRFGNIVLQAVKRIEYDEFITSYMKRNRLVEKRIEKSKRKKLFKQMKYLKIKVENEAMQYFEQLMSKLQKFNIEDYLSVEESEFE